MNASFCPLIPGAGQAGIRQPICPHPSASAPRRHAISSRLLPARSIRASILSCPVLAGQQSSCTVCPPSPVTAGRPGWRRPVPFTRGIRQTACPAVYRLRRLRSDGSWLRRSP